MVVDIAVGGDELFVVGSGVEGVEGHVFADGCGDFSEFGGGCGGEEEV